MDRRASGIVLILAGAGLMFWYHRLTRAQRETVYARMTGGAA